MPRRVSSSQLRSKLRQAQAKNRQAVSKWNSQVRSYNNAVRRRNTEITQSVNAYNRQVRAFNARNRVVRTNLDHLLHNLSTRTETARQRSLYSSVAELYGAYQRLDTSVTNPLLANLAERDTSNSIHVLNTLIGDNSNQTSVITETTNARISANLAKLSPDLGDRWLGAIYALNPDNPDAARHFCTSSREIIANIIDGQAPDDEVRAMIPDCEITPQGSPTRRSKIEYCLIRRGNVTASLEGFIDANIRDLTVLFRDLNAGSHGPAGKFSPSQLAAIKTRVEDAIGFVCEIVS